MRPISPIAYTDGLTRKNTTPPTSQEEAERRWGNYATKPKKNLRKKVIEIQSGLCAYSEINLEDHGYTSHLEHIKPKSQYPELTFDFNNIVVSALTTNEIKDREYNRSDVFGGEFKQRAYNEDLFISCTDPDCSKYFTYINNGEVHPHPKLTPEETDKAKYTISTLNLNSPILVGKRELFIQNLKEQINNNNDIESVNKVINQNITSINNSPLLSFYSISKQTLLLYTA